MESLTRDMQRVLSFPDHMEKTLQQPARHYVKTAKAIFRTPADIFEHPTYYSFILDMPGLEVSNIKVKIENGLLHVAGKKKKAASPAKAAGTEAGQEVKPIRIERRRARYLRKFTLPQDANQENVKATYRDGVLTVNVAKKPRVETAVPKTVSIPVS